MEKEEKEEKNRYKIMQNKSGENDVLKDYIRVISKKVTLCGRGYLSMCTVQDLILLNEVSRDLQVAENYSQPFPSIAQTVGNLRDFLEEYGLTVYHFTTQKNSLI